MNELVYIAKSTGDPDVVDEKGKWRANASGYEWRSGTANIASWASADQGTFYNGIMFNRLNESRISNCHP
jgi:hypothetical protein